MSQSTPFNKRKTRRRLLAGMGVLIVLALGLLGISRTEGTAKQEIKVSDPSVWAVRSGATSYYGEVNTAISELSSVHTGNSTSFPISGVLQHGGSVVLYSMQNILPLDPARPADVESGEVLPAKPLGADQVVAAGPWALFFNRASGLLGAIEISNLAAGEEVVQINEKPETEQGEGEEFFAATITDKGLIYATTDNGEVLTHNMADGSRKSLASGIDVPDNTVATEMTVFDGDHWALLARLEDSSRLWIDGNEVPFQIEGAARLAEPAPAAASLALADQTGLHFLDAAGSETSSQTSEAISGATPAAPLWRGTCTHASWSNGYSMFASTCSSTISMLEFPDGAAGTTGDPVFRVSGSDVILNDTGNGLIWQLKGRTFELVASSAEWQKDFEQMNTDEAKQNQDAKSNECPIPASGAMADFGVRPGQATNIPVLVAAQDPNPGDTISVIPSDGSPAWNGDGIGDLSLSTNNQTIALVPSTESGTATFAYTMTDGQSDCAVTGTATVAVHPDNVRTAPEYRAAQNDSVNHMQVSPGGSIRFDGLAGWVDPDGDPIFISSVSASAGTAAFTPQGVVAYRAEADQEPGQVTVTVNVSDGHGDGVSSHNYTVMVSDNPTLYARSFSRSVPAGTTATIDLSENISGIAVGDVRTARAEITSATVENEALKADIQIQPNSDELSLTVTPTNEGVFPITYSIESGSSQATGTVLVNSHKTNTKLSTPALTAFVRPSEDVTIDPLSLVTNPSGKVLMVRDVQTAPVENGALSAAAIGGSQLRIAGQTPTGQAGRVGTVNYTLTDGEATAHGQVTVFELDEGTSTKPVTVPDQVTVRSGSQVDIPVLANDIAAGGTTLTLDASVTADNETGLTFASDKVLRYLAPRDAGYYTLYYRAHAVGHSDQATDGQVVVLVTSPGDNRSPAAKALDARVEAGSSTIIEVPTFGADPDGDDTYVASVTQPEKNGSARLMSDGRIEVTSTSGEGPIEFTYTVKDSHGSESSAKARVGVLKDVPSTPVAYNDFVEVAPGTGTVTLDPTLNDRAVGNDKLEVESVEVQRSGLDGEGAQGQQDQHKATIGENNLVTLEAPQSTGKIAYRYTVASVGQEAPKTEDAGSKAEGIIIVNVTDQALPTYPIVRDTLIGSNEIRGESFTTDVLADKTVWAGGELRTELKGNPTGVSLRGASMTGSLSENRQTIPFSVTGTSDGQELRTWAFVKVPQLENIVPELLNPKTYEVKQGESVTIDLTKEIQPFAGRSIEVKNASTSGSRPDASCTATGTTLTYAAGKASTGDTDACHITVQWAGYDRSATQLSIPMKVLLEDAPPTINGQQIAVVEPGQSASYDLVNAVSWPGKDPRDLGFACDQAAGAAGLSVECNGSQVSIRAEDTAQQGATAAFNVRITSPDFGPEQPQARMTVQVGTLSPLSLSPTGVSLTINASSSNSATTDDLVSLNNGIRHYGTLSLVPGSASFPAGFTGTIDGNHVTVTAQSGTTGGQFSGSVRIQDSQGNSGTIPIEITYNARPNAPQVAVASVGDGVVNLTVRDNATASVPAVTGYAITWSGEGGSGSKTCSEGACEITGLQNYKTITIRATAESPQGSSDVTTVGNTYAYASPKAPTISFEGPGSSYGTARISVTPGDSKADQIVVYAGGNSVDATSGGTVDVPVNVFGKQNATTVYAEARITLTPPATANQDFSQTARSNTVNAYSVDHPTMGEVSARIDGDKIIANVSALATGGEGIEWYWILNGQQYGGVQRAEGPQGITFPATAVRQNESNSVAIKAFSTYGNQRINWATIESPAINNLLPITYPSDANGVTYSFNNQGAEGSFALHNVQRQVGAITFTAEEVSRPALASGSCEAQIRWTYSDGQNTYRDLSRSHAVSNEPGTPCYPINVDHAFFPETKQITRFNEFRWDEPSGIGVTGLPPTTDDYDIELLVSDDPNFPNDGGHTRAIGVTQNGNGIVKWNPVTFDARNATYYAKLTISFKNKLEGLNAIGRVGTIQVVAG